MKKLLMILMLACLVALPMISKAQEVTTESTATVVAPTAEEINENLSGSGIIIKQAIIFPWNSSGVQNATTFTIAETKKNDDWGKWNILWDGWCLDAGVQYDSPQIKDADLLLGRKIGTLGDYLPLNFPFKDKIEITVYPAGLIFQDVFEDISVKGASGFAYIKATINF